MSTNNILLTKPTLKLMWSEDNFNSKSIPLTVIFTRTAPKIADGMCGHSEEYF